MSISGSLILIPTVIGCIYGIVVYNRLIALKHNTLKAWSNIDVLLKQRHDELPKLVSTCRQYMKHEQSTLEGVMQARSGVSRARENKNIAELGTAETLLRQGLTSLFAIAEAYPNLKASESFQHLENRITGLEDTIADRREFYNESVNNSNIRIETFPDVIIARLFNFSSFDLLQFNVEETRDVDLKVLFE